MEAEQPLQPIYTIEDGPQQNFDENIQSIPSNTLQQLPQFHPQPHQYHPLHPHQQGISYSTQVEIQGPVFPELQPGSELYYMDNQPEVQTAPQVQKPRPKVKYSRKRVREEDGQASKQNKKYCTV